MTALLEFKQKLSCRFSAGSDPLYDDPVPEIQYR